MSVLRRIICCLTLLTSEVNLRFAEDLLSCHVFRITSSMNEILLYYWCSGPMAVLLVCHNGRAFARDPKGCRF